MALNPKPEKLSLIQEQALIDAAKLAYKANPRTRAQERTLERFTNQFGCLVFNLAKNQSPKGYESEQLVAVGFEGLFVALRRFEISQGYRFSTYALAWIYKKIQREHIAIHRCIKMTPHVYHDIGRILKAREHLAIRGLPETFEALQKLTKLTDYRMHGALESMTSVMSLDTSFNSQDASFSLYNVLESSHNAEEWDRAIDASIVQSAINELSPREQTILKMRTDMCTQIEIGELLGVSNRRVSQIEQRAYSRLAFKLRAAGLDKGRNPAVTKEGLRQNPFKVTTK